jgi:hypothetical protein
MEMDVDQVSKRLVFAKCVETTCNSFLAFKPETKKRSEAYDQSQRKFPIVGLERAIQNLIRFLAA